MRLVHNKEYLAAQEDCTFINAYWRKRGYEVCAESVRIRCGVYGVQSLLVNGLPPEFRGSQDEL